MTGTLTADGSRQAVVRFIQDKGAQTRKELQQEFQGWPLTELLVSAERQAEIAFNKMTDRWEALVSRAAHRPGPAIQRHMVFAPLTGRATPPCDGCTLCCVLDVFLQPVDDPSWYELDAKDKTKLRRKRLGFCAHHISGLGCGVHDRAPMNCKLFDCAHWAQTLTGAQIKETIANTPTIAGKRQARILARGIDLLAKGYIPPKRQMIEVKKQ